MHLYLPEYKKIQKQIEAASPTETTTSDIHPLMNNHQEQYGICVFTTSPLFTTWATDGKDKCLCSLILLCYFTKWPLKMLARLIMFQSLKQMLLWWGDLSNWDVSVDKKSLNHDNNNNIAGFYSDSVVMNSHCSRFKSKPRRRSLRWNLRLIARESERCCNGRRICENESLIDEFAVPYFVFHHPLFDKFKLCIQTSVAGVVSESSALGPTAMDRKAQINQCGLTEQTIYSAEGGLGFGWHVEKYYSSSAVSPWGASGR